MSPSASFRVSSSLLIFAVLSSRHVVVVVGQNDAVATSTSEASVVEVQPVTSPARQTPFIEAPEAGPVLVMALLGSALAVMSNVAPAFAAESSNDRIDYETPANTYARNVAAFEYRMKKRLKTGVSEARKSARRASKVFRNNLKDAAGRSFGVVRSGVSGIGRMADRSMRNIARVTTNGLRRLSGATYTGVERVGSGAGSRIARVGTAARLGLTSMADAYRRSFSKAGLGILGVGSAASRGFSNVARTYMRGIKRLGTATSRIGESASISKRMGEIASDGVSRVAEVANSVPEGITSLASDKKLRDCLLQTMCYVSSPLMISDRAQRKRMLRSMADLNADETTTLSVDDVAVLHERQNGLDDADGGSDDDDVKMDDCDVFKCELASLGRKAFDLVTELRQSATAAAGAAGTGSSNSRR